MRYGEIHGYGNNYNCIKCGYHSKIWISSCPQCQQNELLAGPKQGYSLPANPNGDGVVGCVGIIAVIALAAFTWEYILWFWHHWFITLCLFFVGCYIKVLIDEGKL